MTAIISKLYSERIIALLFATLIILGGCREEDLDPDDPEEGEQEIEVIDLPDWTEETHGNSTDPDYQMVFDHGEVIRFDIVIDSDDWSDM